MSAPYVIVGASLAGAKAAETLREQGYDGPVVLIGEESERPYERPPLSKDYLLGKADRDVIYVHPQAWYAEHDIDLRLGTRVTAVDPSAHEVVLADGSRIGYAKLLLTTGSSPRRLPVPGADASGVFYLRQAVDSDRIKAAFAAAPRVAVIGAGWIGLEVAAAARQAGAQVTILEAAELPLLRVLGQEVAQVFADLHRDQGVDLRFGVQVAEITGSGGRADGVRLADGTRIPAEAVIVGIGITPNAQLAEAAGVKVSNGVEVDARLRSSDPDIYAAGDVANAYCPMLGKHIRVEHWYNALNQPQAAARAMLGQDAIYDKIPYFFTDQYDLGMEYAGYVEPGGYDQVVFRGDVERREFIAFWLRAGRVLAGMNVNVWDVTDAIQAIVRGGRTVDQGRLADPSVPLEEFLQLFPFPGSSRRVGPGGTAAVGDAIVGVVANPLSGRDIRRLVTQASVFPTAEKANMIQRMLTAFGAVGVHRVLLSTDLGGISASVFRAIGRRGASASPQWPEVEFLDGQPIRQNAQDTVEAVRRMVIAGARVIVCLGGDGTARVAASAAGRVPLLALSTGTNNVFPAVREATIAGLAAGLVATGAVPADAVVSRAKLLEVRAGDRVETALVDVAVSVERHVGARAVWDPATVSQLFCAFAEPDAIGLSSILGQLSPVGRDEPHGVVARLAPGAARQVLAPIAPGLVVPVGVGEVEQMLAGSVYPVSAHAGVIAVDGERELTFEPGSHPTVKLRTDGPRCVDVPAVLAASARLGLLRRTRPAILEQEE